MTTTANPTGISLRRSWWTSAYREEFVFEDSLRLHVDRPCDAYVDQAVAAIRSSEIYDSNHFPVVSVLDGPGSGKTALIGYLAEKLDGVVITVSCACGLGRTAWGKILDTPVARCSVEEFARRFASVMLAAVTQTLIGAIDKFSAAGELPSAGQRFMLFANALTIPTKSESAFEAACERLHEVIKRPFVIHFDEAQDLGPGLRSESSDMDLSKIFVATSNASFDDTPSKCGYAVLSETMRLCAMTLVKYRGVCACTGTDPASSQAMYLVGSPLRNVLHPDSVELLPHFQFADVQRVVEEFRDMSMFTPMERYTLYSRMVGPPRICQCLLRALFGHFSANRKPAVQDVLAVARGHFARLYRAVASKKHSIYSDVAKLFSSSEVILSENFGQSRCRISRGCQPLRFQALLDTRRILMEDGLIRMRVNFRKITNSADAVDDSVDVYFPFPLVAEMFLRSDVFANPFDILSASVAGVKKPWYCAELGVVQELSLAYSPLYKQLLDGTGFVADPALRQGTFQRFGAELAAPWQEHTIGWVYNGDLKSAAWKDGVLANSASDAIGDGSEDDLAGIVDTDPSAESRLAHQTDVLAYGVRAPSDACGDVLEVHVQVTTQETRVAAKACRFFEKILVTNRPAVAVFAGIFTLPHIRTSTAYMELLKWFVSFQWDVPSEPFKSMTAETLQQRMQQITSALAQPSSHKKKLRAELELLQRMDKINWSVPRRFVILGQPDFMGTVTQLHRYFMTSVDPLGVVQSIGRVRVESHTDDDNTTVRAPRQPSVVIVPEPSLHFVSPAASIPVAQRLYKWHSDGAPSQGDSQQAPGPSEDRNAKRSRSDAASDEDRDLKATRVAGALDARNKA
eukprot:TRINITY_DN9850_c0_g1_i1.p1 TRINITY_DN9850_c0_g1~~TRINITY_DN9850_c0_g1_i1.p1  ORF type:complete len:856 (-),score=129.81 TRINITY_DN9850_c0_g1_i1:183-2750(-)